MGNKIPTRLRKEPRTPLGRELLSLRIRAIETGMNVISLYIHRTAQLYSTYHLDGTLNSETVFC
jgi:hypothetical protein